MKLKFKAVMMKTVRIGFLLRIKVAFFINKNNDKSASAI